MTRSGINQRRGSYGTERNTGTKYGTLLARSVRDSGAGFRFDHAQTRGHPSGHDVLRRVHACLGISS
jgi:hypothetical protein